MPSRKFNRTKVFVSYSRQDTAWLERLRVHLKPLQRDLEIDIWDDSKIEPGKKWKEEIASAINSTKVAVLLVSANFLASDFIATGEVPPLLNAAQQDGAIIVPLILSPSRFTKTEIADFESINDPADPLVNMTWGRQEEVLDQLASFIENAFTVSASNKTSAQPERISTVPEARKKTKSPQDIPQLNTLIADIKEQLEETFWERGVADVATQIAATILMEGLQAIAQKAHPKRLARDLLQCLERVSTQISESSKPLAEKDVSKFLQVHSGDKEVADLLSEAISKVGWGGPVVIEPGRETEIEIVPGLKFDRGYLAPEFITDHENRRVVFDSPYILITEKRILSSFEVLKLGASNETKYEKFVVIAGDIEQGALTNVIAWNQKFVVVRAPGYGDRRKEMLKDIGVLTGGTVILSEDERQLGDVAVNELGRAKKVIIDEYDTTIVDGQGANHLLASRVQEIKTAIEITTSDYDREKFTERLGKLVAGVAVVRSGGRTDAERQKRTRLFEWLLRLYYGAIQDGVVPAEHLALVNAATHLREFSLSDEEQMANSILALALETPLQRMVEGLGRSGEETLLSIRSAQKQKKNQNVGYYGDDDSFVDLVKAAVVLPKGNVLAPVEAAVRFAADKLGSTRYTEDLVRQFSAFSDEQ